MKQPKLVTLGEKMFRPERYLTDAGKWEDTSDPVDVNTPQPDHAMMAKEDGHCDRGNPLEAELQGASRHGEISLVADELARLFQWLLVGGEKRKGPAPAAARDMSRHQLEKALRRPAIIGYRVIAMLMRMRPDLLDAQPANKIARKLRISPRMMAFYTLNFSEHFPTASKPIKRRSKTLTKQIIEARHAA